MITSCNTIVNRRYHVQYLTVSKSYSDNCTCSLTEQNTKVKNLHYGLLLSGIRCILLWLSDITAQPTFESSFDPSV